MIEYTVSVRMSESFQVQFRKNPTVSPGPWAQGMCWIAHPLSRGTSCSSRMVLSRELAGHPTVGLRKSEKELHLTVLNQVESS